MKIQFTVDGDAEMKESWINEVGEDFWIDIRNSTFDKIESLELYFDSKPAKGDVICLFDFSDLFGFTPEEYRLLEAHSLEVCDIWYFKDYVTLVLNTRTI